MGRVCACFWRPLGLPTEATIFLEHPPPPVQNAACAGLEVGHLPQLTSS